MQIERSALETLLPLEARLRDPADPDQLILPTYDERGLLLIDDLISSVASTIDPSYKWQGETNVHHFYWPDVEYIYQRDGDMYDNPSLFRNLPIHKGLLPKTFHAWLHLITEPPIQPDPDIMQYRNEAWVVVKDLYEMARLTVVTEKQTRRRRLQIQRDPSVLPIEFNGVDLIGEAIMQETLERNFKGYEHQLERQDKIPKDHRLIDLEGSAAEIATQLGKIVVPKSLNLINNIAA